MDELSFTECMYKCHNDNIANDKNKQNNRKNKNYNSKKPIFK